MYVLEYDTCVEKNNMQIESDGAISYRLASESFVHLECVFWMAFTLVRLSVNDVLLKLMSRGTNLL